MTDDPAFEALRIMIHADIDKAVRDELERARQDAERARRSIGQRFGWEFARPHSPKFYDKGD